MTGKRKRKRKRYSADFKAKVALEALNGELTLSQLATKHGVHQTMIAAWRKQAIEGLSGVFSGKAEAAFGPPQYPLDQVEVGAGPNTSNPIARSAHQQPNLLSRTRRWMSNSQTVAANILPRERNSHASVSRREL
jgi:transposase